MHVLVAEDSRTQALDIQFQLEEAGFQVRLAANGRLALAALAAPGEAGLPDVILTDLEMPEMNGLKLVQAVRRDFPALPVVLMTAVGSEEIAVRALQQGAASYVPKKNLKQEIVETLERLVEVARASRSQDRVLACLRRTSAEFELDNDPALTAPLIGCLEQQTAHLMGWDRTERTRVGVALHEALLNAIYHGNLELSSDLRQQDERIFHDLGETRRRQDPYRNRRVHVRLTCDRDAAVFVIRDEGPGFDPRRLPDPTDPANLDRVGGRGLMLIRTFMSRVEHNAAGNEITLVKKLKDEE